MTGRENPQNDGTGRTLRITGREARAQKDGGAPLNDMGRGAACIFHHG